MKVAVVGGGMTGLAVAWHLRDDVEVDVFEADDRAGGQVRTRDLDGIPIDVGADAMLARQPEAVRLAEQLGFGAELVAPATRQVQLWIRGRLRPLPDGLVLGTPTDVVALARSGVLRPRALARAGLEPLLPRRREGGDRSVADLVGERFGRDVVDTLVEPLLGGVYAGDAERLSAAATVPPVWEAASRSRSLLVGLFRQQRADQASTGPTSAGAEPGPVFQTIRGGLSRLTDRLAEDLGDRLHRTRPVRRLERQGRAWKLVTDDGEVVADRVVVAVPAAVAAALLAPIAPDVARELAEIRTASVAVVALAYDREGGAQLPVASGILVPRSEGRLIKAVTFSSRKWPHLADAHVTVLRASVGRVDDDRGLALDDATLLEQVDAEVRAATGLPRPAVARLVQRWPQALPQYDVGHLARVDRIRHGLRVTAPGIHLAGASFDGLGLAARAREAEHLAAELRRQ